MITKKSLPHFCFISGLLLMMYIYSELSGCGGNSDSSTNLEQPEVPKSELEEPPGNYVDFNDISGISSEAKKLNGSKYQVSSPVLFNVNDRDDLYLFNINNIDLGLLSFKNQYELTFSGTAGDFNSFANEMMFLTTLNVPFTNTTIDVPHQISLGEAAVEQFLNGIWHDGIVDFAEALYLLITEIIKHPIKSTIALKDALSDLWNLGKEYAMTDRQIMDDLKIFAESYFITKRAEVGDDYDLNYEKSHLIETRIHLNTLTSKRMVGEALVEAATLFVTWAKVAKVAKTLRKPKVSMPPKTTIPIDDVFIESLPGGKQIVKDRTTFQASAKATQKSIDECIKRGERLLKPTLNKLAKANIRSRLNKLMYEMHYAEKYLGIDPSKYLDEAIARSKGNAKVSELLNPINAKKQLLENYELAAKNEYGIFDNPENIKKLYNGNSPIITKGRYKGEKLEVDHVIPQKHAPELSSNINNAQYLPASVNRSKGAGLNSPATKQKIKDFEELGWDNVNQLSFLIPKFKHAPSLHIMNQIV